MTVPTDTLREELDEADARLRNAAPTEVIDWALERFSGNVAMACSFEDLVLIDLALSREAGPRGDLPRHGLPLPRDPRVRPPVLRAARRQPHHDDARARGRRVAVRDRAVLRAAQGRAARRRALEGRDAWLTALKRVDAPTRADVPIVSLGRAIRPRQVQPHRRVDRRRRRVVPARARPRVPPAVGEGLRLDRLRAGDATGRARRVATRGTVVGLRQGGVRAARLTRPPGSPRRDGVAADNPPLFDVSVSTVASPMEQGGARP